MEKCPSHCYPQATQAYVLPVTNKQFLPVFLKIFMYTDILPGPIFMQLHIQHTVLNFFSLNISEIFLYQCTKSITSLFFLLHIFPNECIYHNILNLSPTEEHLDCFMCNTFTCMCFILHMNNYIYRILLSSSLVA